MGLCRLLAQGGYGAIRHLRNHIAASLLILSPVLAEPVTIAALGDSLTQGYGLPAEEGLVPQLGTWLSQAGAEAVLINAGVSGDTTAGGLSRVGWTLTPEVDAMIVALGGNDLLRGIAPAEARANLRGIMEAAQSAKVPVLLIGFRAPGNYGPDYKKDFEAIYPELAQEFGALYVDNFLAPMAERITNGQWFADLMQPDGLHPNAEGVKLIVDAIGPSVLDLVARVGE